MKKIPLRRCVVTQERLPKKELIRVVKTPEGNVIVDTTSKANGRGAYLKLDAQVFAQAKKSKILDKQLEITVPDEVYEQLENLIK